MSTIEQKGSSWNAEDTILVDTIADLKNVVKQSGIVWVKGHSIDGVGYGSFRYDSTQDQSEANGGTIIDPTGDGDGTGCWVRNYSLNEFSLEFFGVLNNSTDNLLEAYGVEGAVVTINTSSAHGVYKFSSAEVADHDGITNFNGWVSVPAVINDHTVRRVDVLDAKSYVNQLPTTRDTPLQLTFGSAQNTVTDDVMVDALGNVTFNVGGHYSFQIGLQNGRENGTGTARLFAGWLLNGVPVGNSICFVMGSSDYSAPYRTSFQFEVSAGAVLTMELIRDSLGNDDGGAYTYTPTLVGRPAVPSTSMVISKFEIDAE